MKKLVFTLLLLSSSLLSFGQGYNHQWLLGSYNFIQDPKGRMLFDSSNYILLNENRKMTFYGTQANICDSNGNLLMSSNGIWIANATGDTMMNGGGLNPGGITSNWPNGLPLIANNIILPYPNDIDKYVLFHHTFTFTGSTNLCFELYSTIIDITLDGGLGEVIQKNNLIIQDTLSGGIGACRHANGRDWWVVMFEDSSDFVYKIHYSVNNTITISTQDLNFFPVAKGNSSQPTFSPDGTKFITTTYDNSISRNSYLILNDFDRCTGIFSNPHSIYLTSGDYLYGVSFSPSGEFIFATTSNYIFQINANNLNVDTVAIYDGFISPVGFSCCQTTFWNMYLAANGKIYVTSGSGVQHLHEINYPDSAGLACDVQQHSIFLGYAQLRAVPNHPNYYLGCDTTSSCPCLTTGIEEPENHDFKFSVSPNPNNGNFKISYLLPQNEKGKLEIYDVNGRKVYEMNLPPWSTMQSISLPVSVGSGVYNCVIVSDGERVNRKIAVFKE